MRDGHVAENEREMGGGDEGTRTPDPCDANAVLSQLSYIPTGRAVRPSASIAGALRGFPN